MAEAVGIAAGGHPNLNLSPEEKRAYGQLFKEADPDGFGAVSGDVAVKFFEKTKLPADVLGQIWQIADNENRGFLTPSGFGVVLRLIGHAQAGRVPVASIAPQPAPLPKFDGMTLATGPITAQSTGTPSSPSQGGPPPVRVPALSQEKVAEYSSLFDKSGAENGMLFGTTAKQIFERAKLPNDVLSRIWTLSDTQGRGSLDVTEFVIAMHLLASCKSGAMRGVPSTLPAGLYEAAARRPPPRMGGPARPSSFSGPGGAGVFPQMTGYNQTPQSPVVRQQASTPLSAQSTGDWVITPADKARFDAIFASVDTQGLGYLTGEQAVEFFGNARLPEEMLAQIWDLADINSEGQLDRDEFAVAMYLIRQQRGTKDGRGNLPASLPPALIPPSRRRQQIPPSQPTAPAFENAPVTKPRSAAEDLFGLDVMAPTMQPAAPQVAQSTGGTDAGPFANPMSAQTTGAAPPPAAMAAAGSLFRPFEPSSSFGRSLAPQQTGPPAPAQTRAIPATILESEDLLSDGDAVQSRKLTNETAELGNLSNQVGNLSSQMTELQGTRAQAEQELSQNNHQKRAFETRLAQLRTAYEKEVQEVRALQEQLTASKNETKRIQQDMAMIEGSHADLQTQHQQLRTAFETDQRENTALKEKIRQMNAEAEQLKPQLTKIQSDARQQKGLVAINKKQLATNEAERDRIRTEIDAAHKEHESARSDLDATAKELEDTTRHIETSKAELETARKAHETATRELAETTRKAATSKAELETTRAIPHPQMPTARSIQPLASPDAFMSSNPFMRRSGGEATLSPPMGSPEPAPEAHSAFDNIFGPSFGGSTAPAPATSFRSETPPAVQRGALVPEPTRMLSYASSTGAMTPSVVEPPTPPSGRQLTSDQLPFRVPLERADSISSSVQVAPPGSRLSPADTPRALTPTASTPSPRSKARDDDEDLYESAAADDEQASVRAAVARSTSAQNMSDIPGAFPEGETPAHEGPAQGINQVTAAIGAGAAAVAASIGIGAAATNHHEREEANVVSPVPQAATTRTNNFDEYFGGPAHQRTPSEQVKDFDSAFASMKSGPHANETASTSNQEFPAIQEVDNDDDSSLYSEETPLGFEDDFGAAPSGTTTSTLPPSGSKAVEKMPEAPSAVPAYLQARPPFQSASSAASSLPDFSRETSPPTYGDSVPNDNPSHFPREFKGLLPEREDPTSPTPTAGGSTHPATNPSGSPPAYGPEVARTQDEALSNVAHQAAVPTAISKPAAFDFDSAFASVGPAQVEDDDSEDEATAFGSTRHQVPEFDPTFDSPAQSRPTTMSNTLSSSAYQSVTSGSGSFTNGTSTAHNYYGSNNASPVTTTAETTLPPISTSSSGTQQRGSHDWNSLFATLNTPTTHNTVEPVASPTITQASTVPEASTTTRAVPAAESRAIPAPLVGPAEAPSGSTLKPGRPELGRALTAGTEHDDPILKRLTSMGWSRADSLAALEQFDYNIDKAADYLTFRT